MLSPDRSSNRLPILAERIRREHAAVLATYRKGIAHALACGDLLIEAKTALVALAPYGGWEDWLAENCPDLSMRTAYRYMRFAGIGRSWRRGSATVAELTWAT